jgi:hypothetical protein
MFDICFLFLNNPRGGVEDIQYLRDQCPWIKGVYCNVRDYAPAEWEKVILPRARQYGLYCGPWGRTTGPNNTFAVSVLDLIIDTADRWGSPVLINSEKELDGSGDTLTKLIAAKVGGRSAALSTEPWLFDSVDYRPISHLPVLLQIFPLEAFTATKPYDCRDHAWKRGVKQVYFTFGTSEQIGYKPAMFNLQAPYSLFTGDPPMSSYTLQRWAPTSVGFQSTAPIQEAPTLPQLSIKQVPYTGLYCIEGKGSKDAKHKGPTAEALARALSRLGYLPWGDFDQPFGQVKQKALAEWQADIGMIPSGMYGTESWENMRSAIVPKGREHAGEYALDRYARKLIQDEAGAETTSDELAKFQKHFVKFSQLAIANEKNWHYTQGRPGKLNINPSAASVNSDCSLFGIQAADYARRKAGLTNVIQDPAKQNWTGYGNTDWYEDDWPRIGSPFIVGDAGHFHSSRHVIWCIKAGTVATAEWVSHGAERGPERIKLLQYYRFPEEWLYAVRPEYVKEAV